MRVAIGDVITFVLAVMLLLCFGTDDAAALLLMIIKVMIKDYLYNIVHPNASPGCIVSPRMDQSECLPDMQIFSPNSFDDAEL